MKFTHFETESGNKIKTAQFDGYSIAERTLEGLMFQVDIQDDGTLKVYVRPEDEDFFDQFNTTKWLKTATEFAEGYDNFEDPISGEDCWLVSEGSSVSENSATVQPMVIKTSNPFSQNQNSVKNYKDSIMDMAKGLGIEDFAKNHIDTIESAEEEVKEPVIGDFKPKDKFIEFIGGKGNVNFISNEATIEAKYLSGLDMDGIVFKLTICDEGTVNFDEVDTNQTTKEQRGRLLEIISEKTITPFRKRMVIQELPFQSVKKVNDNSISLYLSVEYQKPIEKLTSLFDDEETEVFISDDQSSKLDALMSMFDDEEPKLAQVLFESETEEELAREFEGENDIEVIATENIEPVYDYNKQMEESFTKMKQEKVEDLTKRLDNKKKELGKFTQDMKLSTKKVGDIEDEIKLLESRLESLQPDPEFTGYYFNVSERLNEKINLEPEIADLIKSKISKVKSINVEPFMKLFEDGEYHIRLGSKSMDVLVEVTDYEKLSEDAQKALSKVGIKLSDGKLIYMGELNWGDIVNKMNKLGFSQDSEFDKQCGSNSYQASQYGKVDITTQSVDKEVESESVEPQFKDLVSFDTPTDIVIYGNYDDIGTKFQITDDESVFDLNIGGKKISLSSTGFGSVVTLDEYNNLYSHKGKEMNEWGIVDGVFIPNFQGTIGIGAINGEGRITSDIDLDDFIEHQSPEDEYYNVIVNVPGNYKSFKLNEDLSLPLDVIRDIKIDNIIK